VAPRRLPGCSWGGNEEALLSITHIDSDLSGPPRSEFLRVSKCLEQRRRIDLAPPKFCPMGLVGSRYLALGEDCSPGELRSALTVESRPTTAA